MLHRDRARLGPKAGSGRVGVTTALAVVSAVLGSLDAAGVQEECLAPLSFASHAYEEFHVLMPLYVCRRWNGIVAPMEGQRLAWVRPLELRNYPMPPADAPLIAHLVSLL